MGRLRTSDEFTRLFPHLREQLVASLVATFGPDAGWEAAADVLTYARHHWVTVRHRNDLVPHLFKLGLRMAERSPDLGDDPVAQALRALSPDQRRVVVLSFGGDWPLDAITEVTGESVAALHRHRDLGFARVGASLRSNGVHDPVAAVRAWFGQTIAALPPITLGEIDARPTPHAVPISGWRRFTSAAASVAVGLVIVIVIGWIGVRLVRFGDRQLERWAGPGVAGTVVTSTSQVPSTTGAVESLVATWTRHEADPGLPSGDARDVAIGPDGSVWAAFEDGMRLHVAVLQGGEWVAADAGLEEREASVRWLAVTGTGDAWMAIGSADGGEQLLGYTDGSWSAGAGAPSLWGSVVREGSAGQLWVAGLDERARPTRLEWALGSWNTTRADATISIDGVEGIDELAPEQLKMRVAVGDDGVAWYAGDGSTIRFDGRRVTSIDTRAQGWVAIGPDGGVWIPTEFGVRRFLGTSWTYFDARHGLPGVPPLPGAVRFGVRQTWIQFPSQSSTSAYVFDGDEWAPSESPPAGSGLAFFPRSSPRVVYTPEPLAIGSAEDVVWRLTNEQWVPLPDADGGVVGPVRCVRRSPTGALWIITEGRLVSVVFGEA